MKLPAHKRLIVQKKRALPQSKDRDRSIKSLHSYMRGRLIDGIRGQFNSVVLHLSWRSQIVGSDGVWSGYSPRLLEGIKQKENIVSLLTISKYSIRDHCERQSFSNSCTALSSADHRTKASITDVRNSIAPTGIGFPTRPTEVGGSAQNHDFIPRAFIYRH